MFQLLSFQALNKTCMKYHSRRGCMTFVFIIGVVLYIVNISVLSQEIHWWNNRNISFILNNLKLASSTYDKDSTAYIIYRILKTRIDDVCSFPPDSLYGYIPLNRSVLNMTILKSIHSYMEGGHYGPPNCTPVQKVAIIVPYRDRKKQLQVFLNNMIPKLKRQQLEFAIYVIEQKSGVPFNRGMMANIGFKEAVSDMEYDCIVFHDVDVLPEDDRNFYVCSDNPIHMSVKSAGKSKEHFLAVELKNERSKLREEQALDGQKLYQQITDNPNTHLFYRLINRDGSNHRTTTYCLKINGEYIYLPEDQRMSVAHDYEDLSIPEEEQYDCSYLNLCKARQSCIQKALKHCTDVPELFKESEIKKAIDCLNTKKTS
ncbi:B4GALT6 [Mytilus coruscus]|uniref:Beta-1,4-galactosyltransferase n=1 Tax=Mytilus coruscus TaxID=42192 RepID=A0A6J8DKG1_MYTCO|nr:B4GALT6 [Mytilus coruscus]